MTPFSIAVLAFSMSADACAAAMARGAATRPRFWSAIRSGAVFGTIEAITPLVGWAIGLAASRYIVAIDHWIAFILLGGVGGKMAFESIRRLTNRAPGEDDVSPRTGGLLSLVLTALATSIDAAAVGVTLALVSVNILSVALAIGAATFTMATAGLLVGRAVGARFGPVVELIGGLGLVAIGLGILLEHTAFLG